VLIDLKNIDLPEDVVRYGVHYDSRGAAAMMDRISAEAETRSGRNGQLVVGLAGISIS
jgi:hypothetical protein